MDRHNQNFHIFIGSSSAGLKYARALKQLINEKMDIAGLKDFYCKLWKDEAMFELSLATIESLLLISKKLKAQQGYAILLFTPDDKVIINYEKSERSEPVYEPRDNVVFEMGLFMGAIGRSHTFCVCPNNEQFRVLTDWRGVANAQYRYIKKPNSYRKIMEPVATTIVNQIMRDMQNVPDSIKEKVISDYKDDFLKTVNSTDNLNPAKKDIRSTLVEINQRMETERGGK
jgi:predicted nucleotide-binding protein